MVDQDIAIYKTASISKDSTYLGFITRNEQGYLWTPANSDSYSKPKKTFIQALESPANIANCKLSALSVTII